jgi:hypothetical protein
MRRERAYTFNAPVHSRYRKQRDPLRAGAFEREGASGPCGTGGHYIVDKKDAFCAVQPFSRKALLPKRCSHVLPPRRVAKPGLNRRSPSPPQRPDHGNPGKARNSPRQKLRLIEPPAPFTRPMEGYRRDGVEPLVSRQRGCQQFAQGPGQGLDACVLVKMNEIPKNAFVGPVAVSRLKTAKAAAAQPATAFGIQWKLVCERGSATLAEELGLKRLGLAQATSTDWDARDLAQFGSADLTFAGEEKVKEGVGDRLEC